MRPDRDYIQVDPALSYGLTEYLRVQDMLREHGWSSRRCIPHGGHQFSLHIAAALKLGGNESYPGEFQPTGGFADDAVVSDSRVGLTDIPGIGFEAKSRLLQGAARTTPLINRFRCPRREAGRRARHRCPATGRRTAAPTFTAGNVASSIAPRSTSVMTTSTTTAAPQQRSRFGSLIRQLWFQVVIGAVVGIAVGLLLPDVGKAVSPLNDWFIGLVKMIVVPVVFCVVTLGIASMDSSRKAGRIGVKALGYFLVLSLLSMLIGLIVANVFKPGAGMNIDISSLDTSKIPGVDSGEKIGFVDFVTDVIPDSLFGAITGHAILSALVVSLLIRMRPECHQGNQFSSLGSSSRSPRCVFKIVGWVMSLAPIGTFGALAAVVANYGASSLQPRLADPGIHRRPASSTSS